MCIRDRPLPGRLISSGESIEQIIAQCQTKYQDILTAETINYLFSVYGAKAKNILALIPENLELATKISSGRLDIRAQIVYAVNNEMAHNLVDILRRRTTLAMNGNYGMDLLPTITEVLRDYCGWSSEQCDRACQEYRAYMEANCIPDYQLDSSSSLVANC